MANKDVLKNILEEGQSKFSKTKVSPKDKKAYGKLHGRQDLIAYANYIDPEFQTPTHILKIAEKLTEAANGKSKRIIINVPPGHGNEIQLIVLSIERYFLTFILATNGLRMTGSCSKAALVWEPV